MDYKDIEQIMVHSIKKHQALSNLVDISREKKCYDAYNDWCVVECKWRKDHNYDDFLIEARKIFYMDKFCNGKVKLYACGRDKDDMIYIFNLNRLFREDYDFRWQEDYFNDQTEFSPSTTVKTTKSVGYIDISQAKVSMKMDWDVDFIPH